MSFQSISFYLPVYLAPQPKKTVIFTAMRTSKLAQCSVVCANPRQQGRAVKGILMCIPLLYLLLIFQPFDFCDLLVSVFSSLG
jgi:hypothetical protein